MSNPFFPGFVFNTGDYEITVEHNSNETKLYLGENKGNLLCVLNNKYPETSLYIRKREVVVDKLDKIQDIVSQIKAGL